MGTLFVWKVPQNPLTTDEGSPEWVVGAGECGAKQHLMTLVYNSGNVKTTKSGSPSSHRVSHPPNGFPPGLWSHNEQGLILFLAGAWLPALVLTLWCEENWADFRKTGPWHRIKSQHRPRHLYMNPAIRFRAHYKSVLYFCFGNSAPLADNSYDVRIGS